MFSGLTATDVAFSMAGLLQAALAVLWLSCSWLTGAIGRSARYWAAFAGFSAASFLFLVHAMHVPGTAYADWIRAMGNLCIVMGLVMMQRGIRAFTGRPQQWQWHLVLFMASVLASWFGLQAGGGSIRVGVLSGVQAMLSMSMAWELYRYARDSLRMDWPTLLPLPMMLGAVLFVSRSVRAVLVPESVGSEMTVDSGLNIGTAFGYVVLAVSLHAMLVLLVVVRLMGDLRRLSRHDGLTGLLNRRAVEEAMAGQLQRSRRSAEAFCALMLDVDNFKRVNDEWGHPVGDLALKHVAHALAGDLREVDRVGRFGGEEFVLVLPGLTLPDALPVAERLRERVAQTPLVHGRERIPLSVSIGAVQWAGPSEDISRLLVRADAALYRAKGQGRNRVVADDDGSTNMVQAVSQSA